MSKMGTKVMIFNVSMRIIESGVISIEIQFLV